MIFVVLYSLFFITTAIWLEASRSAVNSLSGGYIRSLEDIKSEKAEVWLKDKKPIAFALRSLSFLLTVCFTCYIYQISFITPLYTFKNDHLQSIKEILIFAGFHLIYLTLREVVGAIWLVPYRYTLLKISMPVINILRIFLKPYELILKDSYDRTKNREVKHEEHKEVSAEDEILSLVENDDKSQLEEDERRMIQGVFDLNDKQVKEAMTPRTDVVGIAIDSTPKEALKKLAETNFSRLPVYDETIDKIKGVLYFKDFLTEEDISSKPLKKFLHKAVLVPEATPLDDLLEEFRRSHHHMAIVQDKYGGTSGIITIEDILEEIVGEILDEYDEIDEEYEISKQSDDSYNIDAKATITDINKILDSSKLPVSDDFNTIGGCIYSELSRIPTQGETIKIEDFSLTVLEADERSILKVKLSFIQKEEDTQD
ncbi:MAG: hemolysin family protein [Lentisphaerales bacterium]|nr:hemolysin family protein [Lentisphaerales bacterium]